MKVLLDANSEIEALDSKDQYDLPASFTSFRLKWISHLYDQKNVVIESLKVNPKNTIPIILKRVQIK